MFNICQASFKSAHLLNKMALVQSQRNRTVNRYTIYAKKRFVWVEFSSDRKADLHKNDILEYDQYE